MSTGTICRRRSLSSKSGNIFFLLLILLSGLGSCNKTPAPVIAPVTPLQQLVNTDTTLSLFHRLIFRANENGLLSNQAMTVLLPTNAGLRAAGYSETIIDSISSFMADDLVRYHFIPALIKPDSSAFKTYGTLTGYNVYGMTDNNKQSWFNASAVSGNSAMVGQVLTYRLSSPLQAPADSLPQLLGLDSSLRFLAEAYKRTNFYDSFLLAGSYTVLLPNNMAFMNAGYDSLGAIDSANFGVLVNLLKAHVVTGPWFTNTLMGQTSIPAFFGGTISVSVQGGILQFAGAHNPAPAAWLSGNQTAGNTVVIHKINALISP